MVLKANGDLPDLALELFVEQDMQAEYEHFFLCTKAALQQQSMHKQQGWISK